MAVAEHDRRDLVAVILAVGISLAVVMLMAAVLWDALRSDTPGLSENATQVITNAFAGIIGVLGGYIGGRQVERAMRQPPPAAADAEPPAQSQYLSTIADEPSPRT